MFWATLGTLRKGAVYVNDMSSDIQVIHELDMIPTITAPTIPANNVTNFFFDKYDQTGVFGLKDPCDFLDQIEEVGNEVVPFYKMFISKSANVHWNPTRNSKFNLTSFFKISESMGRGFKSNPKSKLLPTNSSKPSSIKDFAEYILQKAEDGKMKLTDIEKSWFYGLFGLDSVEDFTAMLNEALPRMRDMKVNVLEANITNQILKKLDAYWENRTTTSYPHTMEVFSSEMIKRLDKNKIKMFEHNITQYHYLVNLNNSQNFCRDTIRSLFTLKMNTELRETFEGYYLEKGGNRKNNFDKVNEGVNESLKFLTQNIIRSVFYYLAMTIVATLLLEIKTSFMDFYRSNQIPLISNLKLKWQENNPNSPLIKNGENCKKSYIVKASKRHNFNIQEATHETLSAINIQIALWVYMSAFLGCIKRYLRRSFDFDATNEDIGLKSGDFTDFTQSAMMTSLFAGIVSLTFAQYNQYMTRHERDTEKLGKLVYLLSCLCNSLAIFLNQTCYFALGLPYFLNILIIIIRSTDNLDEYDSLPNSKEFVIHALVIAVVILPLKFIPKKFAGLLRLFDEKFILRHNHHIKRGNRSGYDVPGYETALFMFHPSSNNNHEHINNGGASSHPGFFYFSRDPISKKLYQLRFETKIFCKVAMHTFYLAFTFVLLNTLHVVMEASTVLSSSFWLQILQEEWVIFLGSSV